MTKFCSITGKTHQMGNNVSHANNRVRKKFRVNLSKRRIYIPETKTWLTFHVSAAGLRLIDKVGPYAAIKRAYQAGNF